MLVLRWLTARVHREAVVCAVLALAVLVVGSGWTPLLGRDEGRFAQASREMLASGDLVVPTFAGAPRYHKPILIYWCTAASFAAFGVSPQAARLPANLAGAVVVLLVAFTARRRWGPGAGALAGLLLLATPVFHVQARACTADMVMVAATVAAMLALERLWVGDGGRRQALVLWLGLAVAVLAKGPVGPAVALLTVVALWALERRWSRWQQWLLALLAVVGSWQAGLAVLAVPAAWAMVEIVGCRRGRARLKGLGWAWGVPLLLLVVVPWVVAAWVATDGAFLREAVGRHVIGRSLAAMESHGGFPGFYLLTGPVAAFPWFALLVPAVGRMVRRWGGDRSALFHLAWLLGSLALVELVATKLVHYWLPAYPAGVLLVVEWVARVGDRRRGPGAVAGALLGLGLVAVAAVPLVLAAVLGVGDLLLPGLVAVLPLLAVVPLVAAPHRALRLRVSAAAVGSLTFMALLLGLYAPRLGPLLLGPRTARAALEEALPGEPLVVYKARDDDIFFHLPLTVEASWTRADLAARLAAGNRFLGVSRELELVRFRDTHPDLGVEVVGQVNGVDLGRARWRRAVLFRTARSAAAEGHIAEPVP